MLFAKIGAVFFGLFVIDGQYRHFQSLHAMIVFVMMVVMMAMSIMPMAVRVSIMVMIMSVPMVMIVIMAVDMAMAFIIHQNLRAMHMAVAAILHIG